MSLSDGTRTIVRLDEHDYGCTFCAMYMLDFETSINHHKNEHDMVESRRALEYTRNTVTGYTRTIYLTSKDYLMASNHNDNYNRAMKGL
jgi:hypothetical protein